MATLTLFSGVKLTATSKCNYGNEPTGSSTSGWDVTWSNFKWGSDSMTVTLPAVLRRKSTKINSVTLGGSLGSGYLDPTYDNTTYLNQIKACQSSGTASFTIVYSYQYPGSVTEHFGSYSQADTASATSRSRSTSLTNFSLVVDYTDFENTISGVGSFDITPSTSKVLGGKSTLGLTVRILPSVAIGAGELAFKIYPEGKSSSGLTFTNPSALAANTEVTYTNTATLFGIVDSNNLGTIYNGKVDVLLNNTKQGDTIDWTSKLQIKSGYEAIGITSSNMFSWSDAQQFYSTYTAFIAGKSTPQVTIDSVYYHYDNFLGDNSATITLNLSNTTTQYNQTYTLLNGLNTFTCPPSASSTDSTVYNYVFTVTDAYSGSATYPASGSTASIRVLSYSDPVVPDDFIFRYLLDPLDPTQEVIDDEGTFGKAIGDISVTKFQQYSSGSGLTNTNNISLQIQVTSTDDNNFGIEITDTNPRGTQVQLPYDCLPSQSLTPVNGVCEINQKLKPSITVSNETIYYQAYRTNNTYNFTLTLSDGIVTIVKVYQFTVAKSYLSIETTGVTVGKGYDSNTDGDKTFVVNYPTEIANLSKLNGRPYYDTGWVDLSSYRTNNVNSGSPFRIRRIGDIVYVQLNLSLANGKTIASSDWLDATTAIPAEFRPSTHAEQPPCNSQTPNGWIQIGTDGIIKMRNQTGASITGKSQSTWWIRADTSYPVG